MREPVWENLPVFRSTGFPNYMLVLAAHDWRDPDFRGCVSLAQLNMTTVNTGPSRHIARYFLLSLGRLSLMCVVVHQIRQKKCDLNGNGSAPPVLWSTIIGYFGSEKVCHSRSIRQEHGSTCNISASRRLGKGWPKLPTSKAQGIAFHLVPTSTLEDLTQHHQLIGKIIATPTFSV